MAVIPIRNARLGDTRIPIGCACNITITLTVDADLPDPATWNVLRFSIASDTAAFFTVPLASMGVTTTGSGPWEAELVIPLTEANTRLITVGTGLRRWQLDFGTTANDQDVIADGTVPVYTPFVALP